MKNEKVEVLPGIIIVRVHACMVQSIWRSYCLNILLSGLKEKDDFIDETDFFLPVIESKVGLLELI